MAKRNTSIRRIISLVAGLVAVSIICAAVLMFILNGISGKVPGKYGQKRSLKMYWFIPDGFRADPTTFRVFDWALKEGLLPNIKSLMERGTSAYSVPVFPGHTPTNFATLLTGATPRVHGVADGSMRLEGYPLKMVSRGGFSSVAKKVQPIWYTLEASDQLVTLLSVPGSTPPELNYGITIRGRWGGWGADFPAINFHSARDQELRDIQQDLDLRVFGFGSDLTRFIEAREPREWAMPLPHSYSAPREIAISNWGETFYGYLYDSKDDQKDLYDTVLFSRDKKNRLIELRDGEWSDWVPVKLSWETQNDYNVNTPKKMSWERSLSAISVDTQVKLKVIKLGQRDSFRIRLFYNNLNEYLVNPSHLSAEIIQSVGPMVDFVDNFPPQLVYFPEDKTTFLEEAKQSLEWHRRMAKWMIERTESDVIIHSIYTPNQMLTSRWWMGYLDPKSPRYGQVDEVTRERLWAEVKAMYQGIDAIVGEVLQNTGPDTYIVLSSDHGAVPLHKEVRLNNLFAKEGLLRYRRSSSGENEIDWGNTRAIYLQMDNVYVNPKGLGGNYRRASGPEYEKLRGRVMQLLGDLQDKDGTKPLSQILKWEDAGSLDLPQDTVGDLVIANRAGYGWAENVTDDQEVFFESLKSGYKQAVKPSDEQGMWTPFIIAGPGVKEALRLEKPIRHIDQYPTIMHLLDKEVPGFVEGKLLDSALLDRSRVSR